jgi:uncharacterized membrane protein YuzA (DUF378 family)
MFVYFNCNEIVFLSYSFFIYLLYMVCRSNKTVLKYYMFNIIYTYRTIIIVWGGNMYKLSLLDKVSFILVLIGALNWGLLGLLNFNLVSFIFGSVPFLARAIYILVGVSAVNIIVFIFRNKKN